MSGFLEARAECGGSSLTGSTVYQRSPKEPTTHVASRRHGSKLAATFQWLDEHSGFCDCQILGNVEQDVDDTLADWKH